MTASSMSVNVHETYQTAPKAQPAVLSLLAGIKSLAEYTAQQDKVQSGLDRTLTATRAEVDTAREEAETAREEAKTAHQLNKTHEATIAQLRQQLEAERRNPGDERARFLAVQETKAAVDQELTETKAKLERVFEQIDKIRREQGPSLQHCTPASALHTILHIPCFQWTTGFNPLLPRCCFELSD
ncbi:hypothetical protein CF327_g7172 [Tilletia walkeri]|nr:hypothetical protein CF327_g7172 [Tilletia walkeri]